MNIKIIVLLKKPAIFCLLVCLPLCLAFLSHKRLQTLPATAAAPEINRELEKIFSFRLRCLEAGETAGLAQFYDTSTISGGWALEHEIGRIRYLKAWQEKRGLEFGGCRAELSIIDAGVEGDRAWGSVCHHIVFSYRRKESPRWYRFGVRTIHWVELARRQDRWLIQKDWFWDPFRGDKLEPEIAALDPKRLAGEGGAAPASQGKYNRKAAVKYADRYAGVKINGGDGRYNRRYRDFTGLGGDCANFASQVLTDKEAGGIPTDWSWFYARGEGTEAWVRAEALVYHLIDRGLAECIKKGRLEEVAGDASRLEGGDIIGYQEGGEIVHVSVVIGKNPDGYVLVNSHSADRYHVPWDLGWDKDTRYWLLKIIY